MPTSRSASRASTSGLGYRSRAGAWVEAARPKTLLAAVAPVLVGSAVAWSDGAFAAVPALAALVGAMLLQIGANFANDYYDHVKGADTAERVGPTRASASGLLPPTAVRNATYVTLALAVLVGTYLVWRGGWPIVAIGVSAVVAAVLYTGGPWPFGYHGLGDAFVFLFFGPVAVGGTYYVQALAWSPTALLASVPVGFLATAILVVNNVRDVETDARAGKRTLVVRFGERAGRLEFAALTLGAYGFVPYLVPSFPAGVVPFLAAPLAVALVAAVGRERGAALNARLAGASLHLGLFSALLAAAFLL